MLLFLALLCVALADDVRKTRRQLDFKREQFNMPPTSPDATRDLNHARALTNLPYLTPAFFTQQDVDARNWLTNEWGVNYTLSTTVPDGTTYGDFNSEFKPGWMAFPFEVGSLYRNDNVTTDTYNPKYVEDKRYYITAGTIYVTLRGGIYGGAHSGLPFGPFEGLIYTRVNVVARVGDLRKNENYEWFDCYTPRSVKQVVDMYGYLNAFYEWTCKDSKGKTLGGAMSEFYKPGSQPNTVNFNKFSSFLWDAPEKL